MGISLGHASVHSAALVQWPNASASIRSTILSARSWRSGWPWGSRPRWETFAPVKSIAAALGHDATHAPQPMHAAAFIASSDTDFGTSIEFASGALPALALMNPPAWMIRSNDERSTTRSLRTGNALARNGSMTIVSPSLNDRMWSWQV